MITILLLPLAGALSNPAVLPEADHKMLGVSLTALGDVDGDEKPDFAVGDPADPVGGDWAGRVWIVSGAGFEALREIRGTREHVGLGATLAAQGDLDRDGVPDVLVGEQGKEGVGYAAVGAYSLASGELLYRIELRAPEPMCAPYNSSFSGPALAGIGDVDGDGVGDFAVGAAHESSREVDAGCVQVCSGATGKQLFRVDGLAARDRLGVSVAAADDVDGDGVPDLVVGARPECVEEGESPQRLGYALVLSGKDGELLRKLTPKTGVRAFGSPVAGLGDLDGDGRPDVAVGEVFGEELAKVSAFSGADGSLLRFWRGTLERAEYTFGAQIVSVGDVDLDGVPDLLITAPSSWGCAESAVIWSGATSKSLATLEVGARVESHYGVCAAAIGDLDGDGVSEVVVGAASVRGRGAFPGVVHVFSPGERVELAYLTREELLADER